MENFKSMQSILKKAGFNPTEPSKTEKSSHKNKDQKDPWELIKSSSVEKPVFMDITILDEDFDYKEFPVWKGIVAIEGVEKYKVDEEYYSRIAEMAKIRCFREGKEFKENTENPDFKSNRKIKPLNSILLEKRDFVINNVISHPSKEMFEKYKNVKSQIIMTITSYIYPEFKAPSKKENYNYEEYLQVLESSKYARTHPLKTNVYQIKGLETREDAAKWMLKNHPEEYIGFSSETNSGNFSISAILPEISNNSYLGTIEERQEYIKAEAKKYNIDLPSFEKNKDIKEVELPDIDKLLSDRKSDIKDIDNFLTKKSKHKTKSLDDIER